MVGIVERVEPTRGTTRFTAVAGGGGAGLVDGHWVAAQAAGAGEVVVENRVTAEGLRLEGLLVSAGAQRALGVTAGCDRDDVTADLGR